MWQFTRLLFWVTNGGPVFQRAINTIFEGLEAINIQISSATEAEHNEKLAAFR